MWASLKGIKPDEFDTFTTLEGRRLPYHSKDIDLPVFLEHINGISGPASDSRPHFWIKNMLERERRDRWTAHEILEGVQEYCENPSVPFLYIGRCCFDDEDTAESVHSHTSEDSAELVIETEGFGRTKSSTEVESSGPQSRTEKKMAAIISASAKFLDKHQHLKHSAKIIGNKKSRSESAVSSGDDRGATMVDSSLTGLESEDDAATRQSLTLRNTLVEDDDQSTSADKDEVLEISHTSVNFKRIMSNLKETGEETPIPQIARNNTPHTPNYYYGERVSNEDSDNASSRSHDHTPPPALHHSSTMPRRSKVSQSLAFEPREPRGFQNVSISPWANPNGKLKPQGMSLAPCASPVSNQLNKAMPRQSSPTPTPTLSKSQALPHRAQSPSRPINYQNGTKSHTSSSTLPLADGQAGASRRVIDHISPATLARDQATPREGSVSPRPDDQRRQKVTRASYQPAWGFWGSTERDTNNSRSRRGTVLSQTTTREPHSPSSTSRALDAFDSDHESSASRADRGTAPSQNKHKKRRSKKGSKTVANSTHVGFISRVMLGLGGKTGGRTTSNTSQQATSRRVPDEEVEPARHPYRSQDVLWASMVREEKDSDDEYIRKRAQQSTAQWVAREKLHAASRATASKYERAAKAREQNSSDG
jgi:hypothetical protein